MKFKSIPMLFVFLMIFVILNNVFVVFSSSSESSTSASTSSSSSSTPEFVCTVMEEPIVGDWGFYTAKYDASASPWTASENVNFCSDDECGSSAYSLAGYFYAQFKYNQSSTETTQISTLKQTVQLPVIPESENQDVYYLEYFLSSQFETNIDPILDITVNDITLSSYNGNLLLGDLEHVLITGVDTSQPVTITFTTTYTNPSSGSSGGNGDGSSSGFRIGSVIIRKQTVTRSPVIYVDVGKGSDKYGSGNQTSPFSTIQQALNSVTDNGTIYLADGTYCNLASYLPILNSVNIQSISNDPTKTILSGEYQLNLFKFSYSNQPSSSLLSSLQRNNRRPYQKLFSSKLKEFSSLSSTFSPDLFNNDNQDEFTISSLSGSDAGSGESGSSSSSSSSSSDGSGSNEPNTNGLYINVNGITVGYAYSSSNSPGGSALFMEGYVTSRFTNCIFIGNSDNQNRGSISARGNAVLYLLDCIVQNCSISKTSQTNFGPAISMLGFGGSPTISIIGCTLIENQYNILVDETSNFQMANTNVQGVGSLINSLCSIMLSRTVQSTISNCNITNINIGALCIISSTSIITSTKFSENSLSAGPGGNIYISQGSIVTIQDTEIRDAKGDIGSAIFAMELSKVTIINSIIENINASSLISSSDSQLVLENSQILKSSNTYTIYLFFGTFQISNSSITNTTGGLYATQTQINITNTNFNQIITQSHVFQDCIINILNSEFVGLNGFFYSSFSTINIIGSTVKQSNTTFLMISPLSTVVIQDSTFTANQDTIINLLSQSNLTVVNSKFVNNLVSNTANAVLMQYEGSTSTFQNVLFDNNQSPDSSGCIFTYSQVSLINCTATNNKGRSGAVISTSINGTLITIDGGSYTGNNATGGGGGVVFYSGSRPFILNNPNFYNPNNTAIYGPVFATDPTEILLNSDFPTYFSSGNQTFNGSIIIQDGENQTVSGIDIRIFLQISGNTIDSANTTSGIATFNNTVLYGVINSNVTVEFLSNNPNLPIKSLNSTVLPCQPGEIPSPTNIECQPCRGGSYGYNGITCVQCPPINAYCPGNSSVQQFPGYWYDIDQKPYVIYPCNNENCLGTFPSNCANHSFGPLCAQCEDGYYDWGSGCKKCDKISPLLYVAVVVVSLGMIILVQSSDSESGLMTVIIYFAQTLMVLSNGVQFNIVQIFTDLSIFKPSTGGSSIFSICPGPFDYYQQHYFTLLAAPWLIVVLLISTVFFYIAYKYKVVQKLKSKILREQEEQEKNKSISNYSTIIVSASDASNKVGLNGSILNSNSFSERNIKQQKQQPKKDAEKERLLQGEDDDEEEDNTTSESNTSESSSNNNNNNNNNEVGYTIIADSKNTTLSKSIDITSISNSLSSQVTLIDNAMAAPNNQTFMSQQYGAFIKLMLNIYTPIGKASFEIFFCELIGSTAYVLIANNGVSCTDSEYRKALIVSYSLLIVIIGFPLILMILLFLNRKSLNDPHTQRTYGVFILKYKPSFYFWDVVLLLRRLLIILMSTMDPTSAKRSFLLVVVSLVSVLLQLKYQPFKRISDNRLELTSLSLLFICCVYLDNTVYQKIEQWIVIASSIIFLLHTCYVLYSNYRYQIIDQLQHYLYLVSRGKKGRKNSNNTLFGSNSYFLYNQDHIYNDDDFSHNGIFSRKDKKSKNNSKSILNNNNNNKNNNNNNNNDNNNEIINNDNNNSNNNIIISSPDIENINNDNNTNNNNNNNNIEELNNNYYDDSDDYESENDDDYSSNEDDNNEESTGLLNA